jgi:hypothetical protein
MIRALTDAEAAVIEAAVDLDDLRQEYFHGYRPSTQVKIIQAQEYLLKMVADLHNENDGRWETP